MTKKKQLSNRQLYAKSNKKCFHYRKKRQYTKDYYLMPKQKPKNKKTIKKQNKLNVESNKRKKNQQQVGFHLVYKSITIIITLNLILLVKRLLLKRLILKIQ